MHHPQSHNVPGTILLGTTLLLFTGSPVARSQSGEGILQEMVKRFSRVHDFTVTLDVIADIERLSVPPMHARMYFKQPDKVHFETEGTAILPKEGLMVSVTSLLAKYSAGKTEYEERQGGRCYKITLRPRDERSAVSTMTVLVDSTRMVPERIVTQLRDSRVVTVSFDYGAVDDYWMPVILTVTFAAQSAESTDLSPLEQEGPIPRRHPPRKGTMTIRYSDYRINTGLDDALFETGTEGIKK